MTYIQMSHPLFKIIINSFSDLPASSSSSSWWNSGFLLGICVVTQILMGLLLAMHYTSDTTTTLYSVTQICRDVNYGWMLCYLHINKASMSFICLSLHVGQGIY